MALPTIPTLPTTPSRSTMSDEVFAAAADTWASAIPTWSTAISAFGQAVVDQAVATNYNATSASSVTVGTGDKTFVTAAGTLLQPGQSVIVARTSAASTTSMAGTVKSFTGNASTAGTMVVTVASVVGSGGPFTDWTVSLSAGAGAVLTTGDQTMAGSLGIGSLLSATNLSVTKNTTGATSASAFQVNTTAQSDVTGTVFGVNTTVGTQATAFTVSNIIYLRANQGTIGAGSAVTNQYGFYADSSLTGATNNYGFFSNIASGTGRWAFYGNGTAASFFGGNVTFNASMLDGSGNDVSGYKGMPQNAQNGNYTLALTDQGKHLYSANAGAQTITIPTNASVAFPIGSTIAIFNNGTTAITISTTSITLLQAGTANTGNRTLATKGLCTLLKVATDTWVISGAGVS